MTPQRRATPEVANAIDVPRLQVVSGNRGVFEATPQQARPLAILTVVVAALLLIVCTNVANLLLSRGITRQKEISIRIAIGATRWRLIVQMLTESLVTAGVGGALGLLTAYWFRASLPPLIGFAVVKMDWRVTAFALSLTLATGVLFGLAPALRATRVDVASAIRSSRSRLGKSLLVVQVALSLVLMIGAGLFSRTLNNLRSIDVGFNPSNVALFRVIPALAQYDGDRLTALDDEILEKLAAIPGVRSASFSSIPILSNEVNMASFSIDGSARHARTHALEIHRNYFETMGLPIKLGRGFTRADNAASPAVVVVNEAFAREVFPNETPIGHRIQRTFSGAPVEEIVGVVADAKYADIRDPVPPTFYIHDLQRPTGIRTFAVRTAADAATFIPAIRETMRRIDPLIPLQMVRTQTESIERSIAEERVLAMTTSIFGAVALVIAVIGLFGLMSYAVARRTREIGVRMALGADRRSMLRSVMYETTVLVTVGIVIGLAASLALTRLVASRLYGLAPHDPTTILTAVLLMLTAASLAAYLPSRRAARINPSTALRCE
jgi:predicted permease